MRTHNLTKKWVTYIHAHPMAMYTRTSPKRSVSVGSFKVEYWEYISIHNLNRLEWMHECYIAYAIHYFDLFLYQMWPIAKLSLRCKLLHDNARYLFSAVHLKHALLDVPLKLVCALFDFLCRQLSCVDRFIHVDESEWERARPYFFSAQCYR